MIPWSRKLLAIVFVSVAVVSAGVALSVNLATRPGTSGGPHYPLTFSDPRLEGDPHQNTSWIWIAVISSVTSEEPFSSYEAGLLRNGQVIVDPVPLAPGLLAQVGSLRYEFFDSGTYCYPTPCPPPEGPDGLLNAHDYFRLYNVDVGTTYLIRVYWAGSGDIAGEITVQT